MMSFRQRKGRFFQREWPLIVGGIRVGIVFANLGAISKYREELSTVEVAGIDGIFKTLPKSPPELKKERGNPDCPQHNIYDGCRAIMNYVQQFPDIEQQLRPLLVGYVERYWLTQVGTRILSVFGCEYSTNNYLESFHSTLLTQMSKHPNIWDFILQKHNEHRGRNRPPSHLLDYGYFSPVVYENSPNEGLTDDEEAIVDDDSAEEVPEENVLNQVPLISQIPVTYRVILGVHHGSRIYIDNLGFKYYKREARVNRIYLVCERQKNRFYEFCPCTASVSAELIDNRIRIRQRHNNEPADINVHVPFLREAIGARAIDPENMSVSVRTVYNDAIVQYPETANNYTFLQGQRRWKRMRRSRQPNGGHIPENIHELSEALIRRENAAYSHNLQTPPLAFFQQELVVNGTIEGVVFANLDAIRRFQEELATVRTVGIDGTFKTVPAVPVDLKSFLTFRVVFKSMSFPMVYVLLRSRTEETYFTLFNIVRQFLPLNYNFIRFVTDFEKGLMNAIQQSFPESRWGFKRNPVAAHVFRMVLALPHLPAVRGHPLCPRFCMYDGFRAIMQYVGPKFICVFAEDYRTNNYLESFHSTLLAQMGRHPNIWDSLNESKKMSNNKPCFISEKLTNFENQFFVEFNQVRNNLKVGT
ncbi:hypothetical protein AGLY_015450 [Aphis glycines]|uniref:MULE transposase domain-containing protein n=1 Tax=Aphis glycines TaxID=307491 RepID=A0A6G0T158_APHGL|nr:hypothetical protein AGLY_015450 [Aphis glycines]